MDLRTELYEEYELIHDRQSVCNHHELDCIIASATITVGDELGTSQDHPDFVDELIDECVWLMAARVGQPIGKADKRVIDYYRLPWGDVMSFELFPEGNV